MILHEVRGCHPIYAAAAARLPSACLWKSCMTPAVLFQSPCERANWAFQERASLNVAIELVWVFAAMQG